MVYATVVIATHNRVDILRRTLEAMLRQDFSDYEIIVVDDGSKDNTKTVLKEFSEKNKKISTISYAKSGGPAKARNKGIDKAKGEIIAIMDDDCIPAKNWLGNLISPFKQNKKIGITSSYSEFGGTSTAYRKELLLKSEKFDENFPFSNREDTDTVFKIQDLGFDVKKVNADFEHVHKQPEGLGNKIKYGLKRIWIHQVDPLLYKKHPKRAKEFMDIKFGFLRNPMADFKTATGLWASDGKMNFSSPQGIVLLQNKTPVHTLTIILLGIGYVFLVKFARLWGSIKHGKLLI
ncbi:MAG: glycosyltransferase family A protein [Candidatus Diapherotrites archaeon]